MKNILFLGLVIALASSPIFGLPNHKQLSKAHSPAGVHSGTATLKNGDTYSRESSTTKGNPYDNYSGGVTHSSSLTNETTGKTIHQGQTTVEKGSNSDGHYIDITHNSSTNTKKNETFSHTGSVYIAPGQGVSHSGTTTRNSKSVSSQSQHYVSPVKKAKKKISIVKKVATPWMKKGTRN